MQKHSGEVIMVFKRIVFSIERDEAYVKSQMDGFADPTLDQFCPLSLTPAIRESFRQDQAKEEYVLSYIEAAKVLANVGSIDSNFPIRMLFMKHSYAIPCLFLCRQALELAIKNGIEKCGCMYEYKHALSTLWERFRVVTGQNTEAVSEEEIGAMEAMGHFINMIGALDNSNSTLLRYPVDSDGEVSQKDFTFVCLPRIALTTELFIKQISELEISPGGLAPA